MINLKSRSKKTNYSRIYLKDELFQDLSKMLDRCADEYGIKGCQRCNMIIDCQLFWIRVTNALATGITLKAKTYAQFSREFIRIKRAKVYEP